MLFHSFRCYNFKHTLSSWNLQLGILMKWELSTYMLREKVNLCFSSSLFTIRYENFFSIWRMVSHCFYVPLLTQESTLDTASLGSYSQHTWASKLKCIIYLSRSYNPTQNYGIILFCVWTTWESYLFKISFNLLLYTLEPNTSVLRRV